MPGGTKNDNLVWPRASRVFDAWKKEWHQWPSIDPGTRKISGSIESVTSYTPCPGRCLTPPRRLGPRSAVADKAALLETCVWSRGRRCCNQTSDTPRVPAESSQTSQLDDGSSVKTLHCCVNRGRRKVGSFARVVFGFERKKISCSLAHMYTIAATRSWLYWEFLWTNEEMMISRTSLLFGIFCYYICNNSFNSRPDGGVLWAPLVVFRQ